MDLLILLFPLLAAFVMMSACSDFDGHFHYWHFAWIALFIIAVVLFLEAKKSNKKMLNLLTKIEMMLNNEQQEKQRCFTPPSSSSSTAADQQAKDISCKSCVKQHAAEEGKSKAMPIMESNHCNGTSPLATISVSSPTAFLKYERRRRCSSEQLQPATPLPIEQTHSKRREELLETRHALFDSEQPKKKGMCLCWDIAGHFHYWHFAWTVLFIVAVFCVVRQSFQQLDALKEQQFEHEQRERDHKYRNSGQILFRMPNFKAFSEGRGPKYASGGNIEHINGLTWQIWIVYNNNGWIGFLLHRIFDRRDKAFTEHCSFTWSCQAACRLSIVSSTKSDGYLKGNLDEFTNKNSCGDIEFAKFEEVMDPKNGFYNEKDDAVTFKAELVTNGPPKWKCLW